MPSFFDPNQRLLLNLRNVTHFDPEYPNLMKMACTRVAINDGITSINPVAQYLPELIRDRESAHCYISQLDWYEKAGGINILIAQVGVKGSPRIDMALQCEVSTMYAFELERMTIVHVSTLNEKMLANDYGTCRATIHYIPPAQLSLPNFAQLIVKMTNYGCQRFSAQLVPPKWFPTVVFHAMDMLLQPEQEEHWASNHPTIRELTDPIEAMVDHDVGILVQMMQLSPLNLGRFGCRIQ